MENDQIIEFIGFGGYYMLTNNWQGWEDSGKNVVIAGVSAAAGPGIATGISAGIGGVSGGIIGTTLGGGIAGGFSNAGVTAISGGSGGDVWQSFISGTATGLASGAVGAGLGVIAPSFSNASLAGRYAGKAIYAGFTGAAVTGAGMFASDLVDNGQIDLSGSDYFRGMATGAALGAGISVASSLYEYATWDRLSNNEKIIKLQSKFGNNISYDPNTKHYGYFKEGDPNIYIGPEGLKDRGIAYYTARHELQHLSDWNQIQAGKLIYPPGQKRDFMEQRAHIHALTTNRITGRYWIDRNNLLHTEYNYTGRINSYGPDQIWFNLLY